MNEGVCFPRGGQVRGCKGPLQDHRHHEVRLFAAPAKAEPQGAALSIPGGMLMAQFRWVRNR